jgi:ribonuclease HI
MVVALPSPISGIYTDGACSGNPGPGGWGVVIQFVDGTQHELGGHAPQATNNRMELQAAIEALKALKDLMPSVPATLHTDSEYVKNGITKWLSNWKKKGWKTAQGKAVLNQDLWQILDQLNSDQIEWRYVRGHAGHPGNERADAIARAFSLGQPMALSQLGHSRAKATKPIATSEPPNEPAIDMNARTARPWFEQLQMADTVATQGYLLTSSELADLLNIETSTVTSCDAQWVWRNWSISRVTQQDKRVFWQLQRMGNHPQSSS